MSGFTTTPNLGLKKPTTGADNDLWGGHLNENADTLDTAVAGKAATVHTHTASQITDFAEATDDRVAALLVQGTNVTLSYNDVANTLTINAAGSALSAQATMTGFGNVTGGSAVPVALTTAQHTSLVNAFTTSLSGAAPASGGGTTNFLRADGTWQPAGGSYTLPAATTITLGGVIVPASGGLSIASGTLTNAGVISLAGGTGTLTLGTGIARSGQAINLQAATGSALGGVITSTGITNNSGTISAAVGTVTTIVAGGVLTGGTITASGTIGLAVTNGILNTSGTLSNSGVLTVDTASGALLIGAGLQRASQTFSVKPATTAALGGVIVGSGGAVDVNGTLTTGAVVSATAPTVADNTLWFDSTGGQLYIKYNDGNTSQFVSATNLAGASVLTTVGLTGSLTDTLPVGTFDLGPVLQGGTIVNSYAHVASGTLTYTAAIGAPGSLTNVTGMVTLTASTTTSDTVGTATLNNVLTAGQHLWVIVSGTAAPGATVFFSVRVP